MERVYKYKSCNCEGVDLTEIYDSINNLDDRVDKLYFLKYMMFKKDDELYYVNDVKQEHNDNVLLNVSTDFNKVFIINVNQYENNNLSLYSVSNHDLDIYFINCSFNNIMINTYHSLKFINTVCNKLHIENFDKNVEYFPDCKILSLKEPKALNYVLNLKDLTHLNEFQFYQVNAITGTYDLKLLLPSNVKNINIDAPDFNGDITVDENYLGSDYFEKLYLHLNWLWYFTCTRPIDLTSTYDSTKFLIDINSSYSNTIRVLKINPTLIALLKCNIVKKNMSITNLTFIDPKQIFILPNFVNSSWNASALGSYTWTITKCSNISGFIYNSTNIGNYIKLLLNTQLTISIQQGFGI